MTTIPETKPLAARLPYPQGLGRWLLRLPILFYRLGLSRLMCGMNLMVLTTWGRSSGLPRHTAIEFRQHGSKIYVVSAWGVRPNWYHNLLANPAVRLRLGRQTLSAQAQVVDDPNEALRVLYLFRKRAPAIYDPLLAYLTNRESVTRRTLPDVSNLFTIVRLDPTDAVTAPPTITSDLKWAWLPLLAGLLGLLIGVIVRRSK